MIADIKSNLLTSPSVFGKHCEYGAHGNVDAGTIARALAA